MINHWNRITLLSSATIKEAMQVLNDTGFRIVLIVDREGCLIGAVTDGDIRRGLLNGFSLEKTISNIMNKTPIFVSGDMTKDEIHDLMKQRGVLAIPIVDGHKKIIGLETIDGLDEKSDSDAIIVLMAGGFGKRLYPLTQNTPKPMLLLGNKPIIGHIVENLRMQGFKKFFITTHYKHEVIQAYFDENKYLDVKIDFILEEEPLGTAGSLFFLRDKISSDFIVMNSDLLIDTNFKNLLFFHRKHKEMATLCVKQYAYQVPYGVVNLENMNMVNIAEKPTYSHFINAGVYCFNNNVFDYIKEKKHMDMPTLLENLVSEKRNVRTFPIHEYWADIGSMDDYQKAKLDNS